MQFAKSIGTQYCAGRPCCAEPWTRSLSSKANEIEWEKRARKEIGGDDPYVKLKIKSPEVSARWNVHYCGPIIEHGVERNT